MAERRSIKRVVQKEKARDKNLRVKMPTTDSINSVTNDSFVNFSHKLGIGADNALSSSGYGFNPITRIRTTLEWIHRGSWLGGVAVDVVADDMTRAGIQILGQLEPDRIEQIDEAATVLGIWNSVNETVKWSRLYGGCIAVMMVDGQDYKTPLRLETIGKGQFKGLLVLDRWMVDPSLNDLVQEAGPNIGLPKYYTIIADAPALPRLKIHHSRCIRLDGIRLPYWQRIQENLWGISVLERLYDRMIAFDSATTGSAQLVFKSYIRTYSVDGLREVISSGGPAMDGLAKYVDMMRRFQGIEGMTILDGKDRLESSGFAGFSGLSEVLRQLGEQLSGALQIPLVRLFGQSPSGFSTGDTDLKMYYDHIKQQQIKDLYVPMTKVYRAIAQSEGIKLPEGFSLEFVSLWQLTETEKADVAAKDADSIVKVQESGLMSDKVAMQELRQSSTVSGRFTNISDEDIEKASEEIQPPLGSEVLPNDEEKENVKSTGTDNPDKSGDRSGGGDKKGAE